MPGRVFITTPFSEIARILGATVPDAATIDVNLDLAPGQDLLVCTEAFELCPMRWGMIMSGRVNARQRPVMETIINARSETVFTKSAFAGTRRCLVPVDGWYEWTGKTRRKTRWRMRPRDRKLVVFAGIYDIWAAPGGAEVPQVATLTCDPNAEIGDIHHRMGVVLAPDAWGPWLAGDPVPMRPAPDGTFLIEKAPELDRGQV